MNGPRRYLPLRLTALCLLLAAAALLSAWGTGSRAQDLPGPEQAFRMEARMATPDALEVTWRIAEDHYMYRQRFSVRTSSAGIELGEPVFPDGKRKHDEFFGEMVVYDSDVTFTVPVSGSAGPFTIEAVGQGCNEPVGICYPPVTHTATVQSPVPQSQALQSQASQSLLDRSTGAASDTLSALLQGGGDREFLHPDDAFRYRITAMDERTLHIRFLIEPGYYLYKNKLRIASVDPSLNVAGIQLPEGRAKHDEYFGETRVFYDAVDARVALERDTASAKRVDFKLGYQGCAEDGICYPPIEKTVSVALPGAGDAPGATSPAGTSSTRGPTGLDSGLWPVAVAFGSGLLLTFTPCVLPMIPILGGIIVGQGTGRGARVTRLRSGALAAVYVLGTAVTYTAVGALAGLTGDQLQAYFQNIWAIGFIALLLVVMALAMFGVFNLAMPAGLQSRLQARATGLEKGAFGGVFAMGMISALIVGACVSPVLISVLSLAITRGDPWLGGAIMFAMALGMGVFLIALGFGFGHVLPRSGPWMKTVQHAFGVMLLAVAVYLLGAIPEVPVMFLWALLLVGTALLLGTRGGAEEALGWRIARQAGVVALVAWGVLAAVGGLQGSRDILHPVDYRALLDGSGGGTQVHAEFRRVSDPGELDALMQSARAQGKPVMVDYYADWCVDCVRMENTTFAAPQVARALNREFVLAQVDVTDPNDPGTRAIKQSHAIYGPPAMLFFDRRGEEVRDMRRYGYMDREAFMHHIAPLREGQ